MSFASSVLWPLQWPLRAGPSDMGCRLQGVAQMGQHRLSSAKALGENTIPA